MVRLFLLLLLALSRPQATEAKGPEAKVVNAIGCSLFDPSGKLLKKYLGWICGFFPNGNMILGDGFTLTFYDSKMNIVWSKDVHTHHMINYTASDQTALVIASNILRGDTRIDRLEVYDQEGVLLRSFAFTEADSLGAHPQNWDRFVFPQVKQYLTLIESFYRIGKNKSGLAYMAEGNYLAYDAAGILYFFDHDLHGIIHRINMREWKLSSLRDVQVTDTGKLLFYNSGNVMRGVPYTTLEERDPVTGALAWSYQARPPESIYGAYEGNVQLLPNGHVLFSVVMDEFKGKDRRVIPGEFKEPWAEIQGMHRSFEITRGGTRVWTMVEDGSGLSGMTNSVKRLDLSAYYRNKGRY